MKVVFIGTDTSIITGGNSNSWERQKEYAKSFESLTIIIFSLEKERLKTRRWKNLVAIPTSSKTRWNYVADTLKILVKLRPIDLVSCQDPFIAGIVGVLAKLFWGIKLNIQIHNDFFGSKYFRHESLQNYIFYWLGKFNLIFADTIRIVNKRLLNDKRCFVSPVPTDLDFFWAKPHTKQYGQIVTVARLSKQKNLPLFFELARKFPNLKFVAVGEGEERKNLEKILPKNVSLVGQKNRSEVREIFKKSDIFVLTSNYEGWGLVCLEALASGLPVVMTDTGCASEINAIVGQDTKTFVEAVKDLLNSPIKFQKLVLDGQKILKEIYSKKQLMVKFITGLNSTL